MGNVLVLLLAGNGRRIFEQIQMKKQFFPVADKPMFIYPFETFFDSNKFQTFVLVINEDDQEDVLNILHHYPKFNNCNLFLVYGGKTRSESVREALFFLHDSKKASDNDKIFIHDADRPLIKQNDIDFYLKEAQNVDAVTPVVKIHDSLIENTNEGFVYKGRDMMYLVQTPQIFTFKTIYDIYRYSFVSNETDDFRKALERGVSNKVITGNPLTFKVTTYQDLVFFEEIINNRME